MQILTFMHGLENNNFHFEGLQLGQENQEFSCLFQIYKKRWWNVNCNFNYAPSLVLCSPTRDRYTQLCLRQRMVCKFFLLFCKCQIRKFLGSFRNRNSASFWSVPVRKSANCHISGKSANLIKNLSPQICGCEVCGKYLRDAHRWF